MRGTPPRRAPQGPGFVAGAIVGGLAGAALVGAAWFVQQGFAHSPAATSAGESPAHPPPLPAHRPAFESNVQGLATGGVATTPPAAAAAARPEGVAQASRSADKRTVRHASDGLSRVTEIETSVPGSDLTDLAVASEQWSRAAGERAVPGKDIANADRSGKSFVARPASSSTDM